MDGTYSIQAVATIVVPMAGALGYIGKILITAFTRNIERQQDLAEKHLALLVDGVMKQGQALTELVLQNKAHQARSVEAHTEQCRVLEELLRRSVAEKE